MTILIVDDNKEYAESLSDILIAKGYQVSVLDDSRFAYQTIKDSKPDIALLDLSMPVSGFDIAWNVNKDRETLGLKTKIFGITSYFHIDNNHWLIKLCQFQGIFYKMYPERIINSLQELECLQTLKIA